MNKMILATMVLAAGSLQAAVITMDFRTVGNGGDGGSFNNQNAGNTYTLLEGGITLTAKAWSTNPTKTDPTVASSLRRYDGGLGVCNPVEVASSNGCDSNSTPAEHTVDNAGNYDFVQFKFFSGANPYSVIVQSITYGFISGDSDATYWIGNGISIGGNTVAAMGAGTNIGGNGSSYGPHAINQVGNTLIYGARIGESTDGFKIKSITFETPGVGTNSTVPEPGTYALMGAGLLGLGYWRRKKS